MRSDPRYRRWLPVALAAALLAFDPRAARGHEVDFRLGLGGWVLERFGSDVTVLRARATADPPPAGELALFLSCSGADRRLRLTFPAGRVVEILPAAGRVLIRARGPDRGTTGGVRAAFRVAGETTALLSDPLPSSIGTAVAALAGLLVTRPRDLDLLVAGEGAIGLSSTKALRIAATFPAGDPLLFHEVIEGCAPDSSSGRSGEGGR